MNVQSLSGHHRCKPAMMRAIGSPQVPWRLPNKAVIRRSIPTEPTKCDIGEVETSSKGAILATMMGAIMLLNQHQQVNYLSIVELN